VGILYVVIGLLAIIGLLLRLWKASVRLLRGPQDKQESLAQREALKIVKTLLRK
jgi:hypothetical protein